MRPIEPTSEPQYKELLRLLEKEIAGVQEEFQCAEKLNQEKAAIERDACLAPDGEQWKMMLRREETLDRSIDRKVKILLGLRKKSPAPPVSTGGQGDDEETENVERIAAASIPPRLWQRKEPRQVRLQSRKLRNTAAVPLSHSKQKSRNEAGMLL